MDITTKAGFHRDLKSGLAVPPVDIENLYAQKISRLKQLSLDIDQEALRQSLPQHCL